MVSPDIVLLVKTLGSIQRRIGEHGRLNLFLELGYSPQEPPRQCVYGHTDIITLFSPTAEVRVGKADMYELYLANALAGFLVEDESRDIFALYAPSTYLAMHTRTGAVPTITSNHNNATCPKKCITYFSVSPNNIQ